MPECDLIVRRAESDEQSTHLLLYIASGVNVWPCAKHGSIRLKVQDK